MWGLDTLNPQDYFFEKLSIAQEIFVENIQENNLDKQELVENCK